MRHLVVLGLVALAATCLAREVPQECSVGDWSEWSECTPRAASPTGAKPTSFSLPETDQADRGRAMMELAREAKENHFAANSQCLASGECPQLAMRESSGPAKCSKGFAGDYPCDNMDLMSFLNFDDLGYYNRMEGDDNPRGNDIWGWTDPETNDEYAIICISGGTSFVRVTDPAKPVTLVFLYTSTKPSNWRDVKVIDNTAYIGSEAKDHGMQVFDLLRLRGKKDFSIEKADYDYMEVGNSHNIVSNEESKTIFIVGATDKKYKYSCRGGLHFVDVSDRLKPRYAGCYADDGYTHDAQCVFYNGPHTKYQGREICFAYNEDTLTIVDVTDKSNPIMISKEGYTGSMYTHQGWLTEDHTTVLLDDELDEYYMDNRYTKTYVWDVSDLTKAMLKNTYYSTETAIDHNQYILGDYTFQSNYGAGLRILHINQDKYDLSEVAYFDVLPTVDTRAQFEGTWSNYPYFPSKNIIVSSIDFGLFVLRPHYDAMQFDAISHTKTGTQTRVRDILYAKQGAVCPATEHRMACPVGN